MLEGISALFSGWRFIGLARQAFSQPWSGTSEQWLVAFAGCCLLLVAGTLLYVWRRNGAAALAQRFRDMPRQIELARMRSSRQSGRSRLFSLVFWIAVALSLAIWFNWKQGG
jgi:hypothetical protein